jgi:phenylacetate-CoA ligase
MPLNEQQARETAAALAYEIKAFIGVTASIHIEVQGAIERSMGKAKRVIDNRSH